MIPFFLVGCILGLSYLLTEKIPFIKKYKIPPALSSSLLLLFLFSIFPFFKEAHFYQEWKKWPSDFIALVFAALFLQRAPGKVNSDIYEVTSQTLVVWITILGQILIGILLTYFYFQPYFNLPIAFSSVLAGFAGGHGTAVAMKSIFLSHGLKNGSEYSLFSATIGIILGIIGGVFLVNADKKNKIIEKVTFSYVELNPLLFLLSLGLIFASYILGNIFKLSLENIFPTLPSFPLFVYAIFASILMRLFIKLNRLTIFLNNNILVFYSNLFMDILIFTGIATIDIQLIADTIFPLFILFTSGFLWNLFSYYYINQKLLKDEYYKEMAILNFGMFNGTTAIGLMLLRMINPELKTKAVRIYAEVYSFHLSFFRRRNHHLINALSFE